MADKRDTNEKELVKAWRQLHCYWIQMSRDAGFDGILLSPITGTHIVEVKNPERKWKLTDAEKKTKAEVEARGVPYRIIETVEQAVKLARG
jgi:hypothetical protein